MSTRPAGRGVVRARRSPTSVLVLVVALVAGPSGCSPPGGGGEGPGHRSQRLALSPEQELSLGEQAYKETLGKVRLVRGRPLERVTAVGKRIEEAVGIELLRREINLHVDVHFLKWEYS